MRRLGNALSATMLVAASPVRPDDETMTIRGGILYTAAGKRVILRGVNEMLSVPTDPIGARTAP